MSVISQAGWCCTIITITRTTSNIHRTGPALDRDMTYNLEDTFSIFRLILMKKKTIFKWNFPHLLNNNSDWLNRVVVWSIRRPIRATLTIRRSKTT